MKEAIVRLAVLGVLFLNQSLVMFGWNPLPFSEEDVFLFFSTLATAVQMTYVWYRNNNVTKEAEEAQLLLDELKDEKAKVKHSDKVGDK